MSNESAKFQVNTTTTVKAGFETMLEEIKAENGLKTTKEAFELLYNELVTLRKEKADRTKRTTATLKADANKTNYAGSSKERAILFINTLLTYNEQAEELDRVFISPTLVEREAGINRKGVKEAFEELDKKVSAHHKKMNVSIEANRRFINHFHYPRDENGKLKFIADILKAADVYEILKPRKTAD